MRKFGIFHPLVLSFYSQPLYQDVAKNWRGAAFLYLLLVLALYLLPTMVTMQRGMTRFVEREAPGVLKQIPRVSIIDGEVSTDVETPYHIIDPENGKTIIILDPDGGLNSLEGTDAKVLITRHQLIAKQRPRETRVYDLSGIKNFTVDRARVEGWLHVASVWLVPLLFPLMLVALYCFRLFQALVYGLIGLIFAKLLHVRLGLMASVALAIIAITPVLVLDVVFGLAKFRPPAWWLIGFIIAMCYLFFGVRANAATPSPTAAPPGPQLPQT